MPDAALAGCYVISLRPVGEHAALRAAAARHGARVLALSSCRLVQRGDAGTRRQLRDALRAPRVIFTSPTAVRAALALQPLRRRRGPLCFAVGSSTARALARAGIEEVAVPQRMDSEGLLALPGLQHVRGQAIGLVTAPGGRGMIERTLVAAAAQVVRADVYARVPVSPSPRAIAALRALDARAWLALSSGEALDSVLAALPGAARRQLLRAHVVAASVRLAQLARSHGFVDVVIAASARPRDLMAAAAGDASASMRAAAAAGTTS
jgi:uroporphyrinogen-III synthase